MVPVNALVAKSRSERRIAVRLPLQVRGLDSRGVHFEEDTASENLCRNGAAFRTRFEVAIGADLEIVIPSSLHPVRRSDSSFATRGRVVHVSGSEMEGERLIGVQFTGPRFQRVFRSESAA